MIGNDIVDLKRIYAKWQRPGFLDKVFTSQEQDLIYNSRDNHEMVWRLWSMKEATYKVYAKIVQRRYFNPKHLKCQISDEIKGLVKIDNVTCYTFSSITENYVHSTASLDLSEPRATKIYQMKHQDVMQQSLFLKDKFAKRVSEILMVNKDHLSIRKNKIGIPAIYQNSTLIDMDFSLSHCGCYSAYTIY